MPAPILCRPARRAVLFRPLVSLRLPPYPADGGNRCRFRIRRKFVPIPSLRPRWPPSGAPTSATISIRLQDLSTIAARGISAISNNPRREKPEALPLGEACDGGAERPPARPDRRSPTTASIVWRPTVDRNRTAQTLRGRSLRRRLALRVGIPPARLIGCGDGGRPLGPWLAVWRRASMHGADMTVDGCFDATGSPGDDAHSGTRCTRPEEHDTDVDRASYSFASPPPAMRSEKTAPRDATAPARTATLSYASCSARASSPVPVKPPNHQTGIGQFCADPHTA
jgi:hypothetical protein